MDNTFSDKNTYYKDDLTEAVSPLEYAAVVGNLEALEILHILTKSESIEFSDTNWSERSACTAPGCWYKRRWP